MPASGGPYKALTSQVPQQLHAGLQTLQLFKLAQFFMDITYAE